jgi:hypothetical protein
MLIGETCTRADGILTALRVEFCRVRARAHRWQEECLLLAEEMGRVERFWGWDADRWAGRAVVCESLANNPPTGTEVYSEIRERNTEDFKRVMRGKAAYAHRQVALRLDLRKIAMETHTPFVKALQHMDSFNAAERVEFVDEMAGDR